MVRMLKLSGNSYPVSTACGARLDLYKFGFLKAFKCLNETFK